MTTKNFLPVGSGTRPRGRQRRINPSWVVGSAETYRVQIANAWQKVGDQLLAAQSRDDIVRVLDGTPGGLIAGIVDNRKFATLLFEIIHDPTFPKVRTNSQIRFLADSLGGSGVVKPRRSRDICAEERAKMKHTHHILRYEFYVECSCGYSGHSQGHACPTCGAEILFPVQFGI